MKHIVVDSSVSLAWAFSDEGNAYSDRVLKALKDSQMIVPTIGFLELINAMHVGVKRKRISKADAASFLFLIENLAAERDTSLKSVSLFEICQKYNLTAYDASFLILAQLEFCPIATQDKQLLKAAMNAGIEVFGG